MRPDGSTHIENDGTYWKLEKGTWFHYSQNFKKWATYVGKVNHSFLNKLHELGA